MPLPIERLSGLAADQYGCFSRAQARAAGIGTSAIERRVTRGEWVAIDHGVYRMAFTPASWHQRLLAACLAGPAVASHRSAAALWEIPGFDTSAIEVTALRHRRRTSADVQWHESRHLDPVDVTTVGGIPVTNPRRTFLDLGAILDPPGLKLVLDDLLRRRLVSTAGMARRLDELGARRRGAARVRQILEQRTEGVPTPESVLETEFELLLQRFGLPTPSRQVVIRDERGPVGRVDFAYEDQRIAIEIDGAEWHRTPGAQAQDARRDERLRALGWLVLRFRATDLRHRPAWVAEQLRLARFERSRVPAG